MAREGRAASPYLHDLTETLRLAGPVAASRLGIMAMGLSDAIVVGRYSAEQLAFHALGWAPTAVVVTAVVGLLTGIQVMTARAIGERRRHETGAVLRRGVVYACWLGFGSMALLLVSGPALLHGFGFDERLADGSSRALIVFTLSLPSYAIAVAATLWLEAISKPGPAAWAMWGANVVNLGVDLLLVPGTFGLPALGAQGGAWATFTARTVLAALLLAYIARMPEARALGVFDKAEGDLPAEREQRRIGYGAGASNFFEVAAFASMNIIAGWIGGLAVAAYTVVLNVGAIVFMGPLGLSTATAVLVGRAYGARDGAGQQRAAMVGFGVASVYGLIAALVVWLAAAPISKAYTSDPQALALAIPVMALSGLFLLPDALQVVTAQGLRARGQVWIPTLTHLASYLVVMIPLGWFLALPMKMGLSGIMWAIIAASFMAAGLLLGRHYMTRPITAEVETGSARKSA